MSKTKETYEAAAPIINGDFEETAKTTAVTVSRSSAPVIGEFDVGEATLTYSRVKIAYGVGSHPPRTVQGQYFLNAQGGFGPVLTDQKDDGSFTSFDAALLSVKSGYKEWPVGPYNPSVRPKVYNTKQEAIDDGQTVDWVDGPNGRERPTVAPFLDIYMLVRKSEDIEDDTLFNIYLDGEQYAPCVFTADKMHYKSIQPFLARILIGERARMKQKKNAERKLWSFTTENRVSASGMTTPVAVMTVCKGPVKTLSQAAEEDLKSIIEACTNGLTMSAAEYDEAPF